MPKLMNLICCSSKCHVGWFNDVGISWVDECDPINNSLCFFASLKVPLSDDYDERQSYAQTQPPTTRGRGSAERAIGESRNNFNAPSQSNSNKSNREKLIDKLKVRPVTATSEPITTTPRATKEQSAKKTKYTPITR